MNVGSTIKRAPKWAWFTVGGVALGATALKVYGDRDKPPEGKDEAVGQDMLLAGGVGQASPAFGVVTPTVVPVTDTQDPTGLLGVMIDGVDTLLTSTGTFWQDVWGPTQEQNADLLAAIYDMNKGLIGTIGNLAETQSATIGAIAQAGPAPSPATIAPPQIASPAPPPPAPPAPSPAAVVRDEWITRTRDNGKTGAARRVWCNCIHVRQHAGGQPMVVNENKVADGACWGEGFKCTPV